MPTYARCPECHAALPHGAAWCSLCHADLRPPSTRVIASVAPAASEPTGELVAASIASSIGGDVALDADDGSVAPLPPVRGRHRRPEPDETDAELPDVSSSSGSPAPHRSTGNPDRLRADVDALVADAPRDADGRPDVEVLTAQLMARLATSDGRRKGSSIPNLDSVPGGKWGVMVGGMVAIAVVLVVVFGILGALVLG